MKIRKLSHSRERAEKNCLNCNTEPIGRYCPVCGQENLEPRQSFWTLVTHFFEDITHFDGKFFHTLGYLASKPGFLPSEYIKGRRARYLNPIRMYVFASAIFFFVFYASFSPLSDNPVEQAKADVSSEGRDTSSVTFMDENYSSVNQYDSVQQKLPPHERASWLRKKMTYRAIEMNQKYKGRGGDFVQNILEKLVHSLPYLLFLSLPMFAFYLKLLFFRKNYMYTDHAIFLIYLYIFTFIVLLIVIGFITISGLSHAGWLGYLGIPLVIYGVVYTVVAMKRFYQSSTGAVLLKFAVFNILASFTVLLLFTLFLLISFFRL